MKPQCQEKIYKAVKGTEGQLVQCKRYAVVGDRCKAHAKSFKQAKNQTAPQEQSSIR